MPRLTTSPVRHLAIAGLVVAGTTAIAQTTPEQVTIEGQRVADVRAACPDVDEDLNDALWKLVRDEGESGTTEVRFLLRGSRISQVQVEGGPRAYHRGIRRAVRALGCESADGSAHMAHLRIQFIADAPERVALVFSR